MECLADRFVLDGGRWIDLATGGVVRVHLEPAATMNAFDWDEQCGRLFTARHPLLNPLLDYGPAPDGRRFEAYGCEPPVRGSGAAGERLLVHLTEFLRLTGIGIEGLRSRFAVRAVTAGHDTRPRPLGVTLQPRHALEAARETLDAPTAAPSVINIVGPPLSGLRTARLLVARSARLVGFVPVSAHLLVRRPDVASAFRERHLCVLATEDAGESRELAGVLVQIAAASARRHVVVRFTRTRVQRHALFLDPLPVRALVGMVCISAQEGPTEQELFDAARVADGRPGAFLAHLAADASYAGRGATVVHETPQEYRVEPPPASQPAPAPVPRMLSAVLRAPARAEGLARRGRHAAARRLLERASRVLTGRGSPALAAECLVRAGQLALERGRAADAARLFNQAQTVAPAGSVAIQAAIGLGEAWIDEMRFIEAEAVLRGALSAAETIGDVTGVRLALAGLARCLLHHERPEEAIAATAGIDWRDDDKPGWVPLLAALSRCHVAVGRTATAVRLARRAESLAREKEAATRVTASYAVAEALGAVGDEEGMQEALEQVIAAARRTHLPVVAISAELTQCERDRSGTAAATARATRRLQALLRRAVPRLLGQRIKSALRSLERQTPVVRPTIVDAAADIHREAAAVLEQLLQACQQAEDDTAAVAAVSDALRRRLRSASVMIVTAQERRILACHGRPWTRYSTVVAQALTTGAAAASEAGIEPREAADAVRYGGEIIGAIACRWTAGAALDAASTAAVMHAAALSIAGPLRALLDRGTPAPPAAAWGDLLGDSPPAATLREAVARAARAPFPVLIEGESGSGKELVARAIHRLGARRDRKFCPLNCAAISDELVEAELFGHARGAFTGAASERAGLFEEADGGTLFLDEIGELSARAQAKLLRVLQEGEVRRVGENFARRVDTRIVAATNRQLEKEVAAGRFRADLRFRLDVVRIVVPPLRERPADIPVLATHFWNGASHSVGSQATLTPETLAALSRYDWPGNVRELQNVIAWMAVHSPHRGRIGPSSVPAHVACSAVSSGCTFEAARQEFERRFVRAALAGAQGQRARAAEMLGVTRQGLAKMIRRLGLEEPRGSCKTAVSS